MQVGVNVTCMYISFGGRGLSGFGDMVTFQKRPNFPFGAWTIVHGHQKIELIGIGSKNHASRDQYQVHVHQFWLGVVSPVSEILLPFKNGQISLLGHGL